MIKEKTQLLLTNGDSQLLVENKIDIEIIRDFFISEITREKVRLLEAIVWPEEERGYNDSAQRDRSGGIECCKAAVIKAFKE